MSYTAYTDGGSSPNPGAGGWGVYWVVGDDIQNGEELWRVSTRRALRSAPSYADGRIFVTTLDNMTLAFSASTGLSLWSHNGMIANAAPVSYTHLTLPTKRIV